MRFSFFNLVFLSQQPMIMLLYQNVAIISQLLVTIRRPWTTIVDFQHEHPVAPVITSSISYPPKTGVARDGFGHSVPRRNNAAPLHRWGVLPPPSGRGLAYSRPRWRRVLVRCPTFPALFGEAKLGAGRARACGPSGGECERSRRHLRLGGTRTGLRGD